MNTSYLFWSTAFVTLLVFAGCGDSEQKTLPQNASVQRPEQPPSNEADSSLSTEFPMAVMSNADPTGTVLLGDKCERGHNLSMEMLVDPNDNTRYILNAYLVKTAAHPISSHLIGDLRNKTLKVMLVNSGRDLSYEYIANDSWIAAGTIPKRDFEFTGDQLDLKISLDFHAGGGGKWIVGGEDDRPVYHRLAFWMRLQDDLTPSSPYYISFRSNADPSTVKKRLTIGHADGEALINKGSLILTPEITGVPAWGKTYSLKARRP